MPWVDVELHLMGVEETMLLTQYTKLMCTTDVTFQVIHIVLKAT